MQEAKATDRQKNSRSQFYFDRTRHALMGADGSNVRLRPQSLDVLLLLLANANEVVTKQQILDEVWNGLSVTDDSITQCIADIRRALGKDHRSLLTTVNKVGYRLCLGEDDTGNPVIAPLSCIPPDVEVLGDPTRSELISPETVSSEVSDLATASSLQRPIFLTVFTLLFIGLAISVFKISEHRWANAEQQPMHGPLLAVLPFEDIGVDAMDNYIGNGLTEDIISTLSRFSELSLMSWAAMSTISEQGRNTDAVLEEFGVRYLVSGMVRQDTERIRVSVQLTDTRTGRLLWAERFDEKLQNMFLVQDQISRQVAAMLAVKLGEIETQISKTTQTDNITAYQLALLGRAELRKRSREGNLAARQFFVDAIEADPTYADAYIRLGETYLEEALFGWTEWPDESRDKAMLLARAALKIAGANARTLAFIAKVNVRIADFFRAQTYLDRAFELNPNDPALHEIQGLLYLWSGEADKAISHLNYVLRFDPASSTTLSHLGTAYYITSTPLDAIDALERMIETSPDAPFINIILTASLVEAGDLSSAQQALERVHRQHPFLTAESAAKMRFFQTEEVRHRLVSSLQKAGLN